MAEHKISLELNNLSIGYRHDCVVISAVTALFEGGSLIALLANNGMGKSTLLKTLAGSVKPLAGEILLNGVSVKNYPLKELAKKISIVLTEKPQLAGITVYDLVAMGRYQHTGVLGRMTQTDELVVEESLSKCEIMHLKSKNCQELSDGEFQKAMIARALAQQTDIILLDEPTAFLDYTSTNKLIELLKDIAVRENKIVIISSHDLHVLFKHAHVALVIKSKEEVMLINGSDLRNLGPENLFG